MWVVGGPANAFDPDLCHSLAKIRKHWQSHDAQREDAKCSFNWPALQGSQDADTVSLQTLQEKVIDNPNVFYILIRLHLCLSP